MRRGLTVAALLVLVSTVTTSVARADDADSEQEARSAMRRGVAAFGRGDAEKALEEYESAKRLVPNANAPYLYAAEALMALARWEEAVRNLEGYLAKSPAVSDRDDVRTRIARIRAEHYPGRVTIAADVAEATVTFDGESRGTARTLEARPGRHRVELRAPAHETVVQEVDVVGDREVALTFALPEERRTEAPPTAPSSSAASPWRTAGWITAGAGATVLLVTTVVDAAVLGPKIDDYRAAADRGDPSARELHDDATGLRSLAIAGYVTGAVVTAAGLGLALFAPRSSQAPAARLTPWVTPTTAGLGFGGAL